VEIITLDWKNNHVKKSLQEPRQTWTDSLGKRWNTDMRSETWNGRSLYRAGSLVSVSKK
jgi:hypothetical protein